MNGVLIDGSWRDEPTIVKEEVRRYFLQHFQESDQARPRLDSTCFQTIDIQQNEMLVERFHEEEVKRAVWSCGSDKSLGPDGFNFKFIKQFWDIIKYDFLRFLDEFHVNGVFPRGLNASFIALIPKIVDPQALNDYRPISLIGCTYKILAKILANKVKKVMHFIKRTTVNIHRRQAYTS